MHWKIICILLCVNHLSLAIKESEDIWMNVECNEEYYPENCDFDQIPVLTVEDFDRCAPAQLPLYARNYFIGYAGRGATYKENFKAFRRIQIQPKMLRDITGSSLDITTLGQRLGMPIGVSPTALQTLAHPEGDNATAAAAAAMSTVMIVSSFSEISLEKVAEYVKGSLSPLWMQIYILPNRNYTIDIVKRAERSGFQALVLTVDSNITPLIRCDAKADPIIQGLEIGNAPVLLSEFYPTAITFRDITWLKSITNLPIVAKGILSGEDARKAIQAGASAIMVSNHGGRQLDGVPATVDVLPEVVKAVSNMYPRRDVYLDGGIRNGFDVYKALARGAKMVFIGRPVIWGLTLGGKEGVKQVLNILRTEFNTTMLLAGAKNPSKIGSDTIIPRVPIYG